jgi:hypothetical protein
MECPLEFLREDGDRFLHRCPKCGAVVRSRYRDPAKRHRECRVVGVGDCFVAITRELGVKPASGCDCAKLRSEMNQLGPDKCRERKSGLVARLQRNAAKYGLGEWAAAGWSALWQGKPLTLSGLLDLAIQRAESSL